MSFDASLLVMMVLFWASYLILRFFFFKPMTGLLDEREERIASAQAIYDQAAADTTARLEQERARLAEARHQAMVTREEQRREAQERRLAMLGEVKQKIQAELGEASLELEEQVARERRVLDERARALAEQMTRALLGRTA